MKTLKKIFRTQKARFTLVILTLFAIISSLLGLLGGVAIGVGAFITLTSLVAVGYGINKAIDWVMDGDR